MRQSFKSFNEVFDALGFKHKKVKEEQPKEEKEIKCRVCGAPMKRISGTNIIACTGYIKTKDGNMKECENYIMMDYVNQ